VGENAAYQAGWVVLTNFVPSRTSSSRTFAVLSRDVNAGDPANLSHDDPIRLGTLYTGPIGIGRKKTLQGRGGSRYLYLRAHQLFYA
jgi:hypothetical protein